MKSSFDVRDKFVVKNSTKIVQSGSLDSCVAARDLLNLRAAAMGPAMAPSKTYTVCFNNEYEGFRELRKHAEMLGLSPTLDALLWFPVDEEKL